MLHQILLTTSVIDKQLTINILEAVCIMYLKMTFMPRLATKIIWGKLPLTIRHHTLNLKMDLLQIHAY